MYGFLLEITEFTLWDGAPAHRSWKIAMLFNVIKLRHLFGVKTSNKHYGSLTPGIKKKTEFKRKL